MPALSCFVAPDASGGWTVRWELDGTAAGETLTVPPARVADIAQIVKHLNPEPTVGGRGRRPVLPADAVTAIGRELFAALCEPAWGAVGPWLGAGAVELHVRSTDAAVLNAPWELLPLGPAGAAIGTAVNWSLYRVPTALAAAAEAVLPAGPLRILFLAAAPTDQVVLEYEREEEAILRAVGGVKDVAVLIAELGTVDDLKEKLDTFQPHVVHLSGHGKMEDDGTAVFCFENERGRTDAVPAPALVRDVFTGSSVRMVFFNGCETAQARVSGLCQALTAAGLPLALGWGISVADDRATAFAETLYRRIAVGDGVAAAVAGARGKIERDGYFEKGTTDGRAAQDVTFAMPQLYAARPGAALYDRTRTEPYQGPKTVYELLPGGVEGLREGFIGRRREQQNLVPALREGERTVAVLHGIGGQGKSALATRIVNRLRAGFGQVVAVKPVRRPGETPEACAKRTADDLLDALRAAFMAAERKDVYKLLTDPDYTTADKLRAVVDALNGVAFLLVLDNFEDVLTLVTRAVADAGLAVFYAQLMSNLTTGSRAVVTTRYLPAGTPTDARLVRVYDTLRDFGEAEYLKFLRRDEVVARRMQVGELPEDLLKQLHARIGGTPRFLGLMRDTLRKYDGTKLLADLKGATGLVEEKRDEYIRGIFGEKLYDVLTADARVVVTRLAVTFLPVPVEAVAAACAFDTLHATESVANATAYGLLQEFTADDVPVRYQPPGLLAGWLAAPDRLPAADAAAAHLALARFWRVIFEQDREGEVGVHFLEGLDGCRRHAAAGGDPALVLWAANRMARPLNDAAEWGRSRKLLEGALEGLGKAPPLEVDQERSLALHTLGSAAVRQGEYEIARDHLRKAMEISGRAGDVAGVAASRSQLAYIEYATGNLAAARAEYRATADALRRTGDELGEATVRHNLASLDLEQGDYPAARVGLAAVLAIIQRLHDHRGEGDTLHQLAAIDLEEGDYAAARENSHRSMEIRRRVGDALGESNSLYMLASIDLRQRDFPAARENFHRSLAIQRRVGDVAGEGRTLVQLASIDRAQGDYVAALENLRLSMEIQRRVGDVAGEASTLFQFGAVAVEVGRPESGTRLVAACLVIRQRIESKDTSRTLGDLLRLCQQMSYDETQVQALLTEVALSYTRDRGRSLLRDAFPEMNW
ncbi:MAG TPA: tetratricopeptide repeat protein [Urbifossiella sp.]|nr:tetratricopeptide repeat protein [Urbifossiella sp.]